MYLISSYFIEENSSSAFVSQWIQCFQGKNEIGGLGNYIPQKCVLLIWFKYTISSFPIFLPFLTETLYINYFFNIEVILYIIVDYLFSYLQLDTLSVFLSQNVIRNWLDLLIISLVIQLNC